MAAGTLGGCRLGAQRLPRPGCWVWALGWDASCRVVIVHAEAVCFCPGLRTVHTGLSDGGWPLSRPPPRGSVPGPSPCRELVGQQRAAGSVSGSPRGAPHPGQRRSLFLSHARQAWGGPACEGCAQERELPGAGSSLAGVCAQLPRGVTGLSDATGCLGSERGPWAPGGPGGGAGWQQERSCGGGWAALGGGPGGRPRTRGRAALRLGASVP